MNGRTYRRFDPRHLAFGLTALVGATLVQAHGRVTEPASRIVLCTLQHNANCPVEAWQANAMENGKFFPATQAGLADTVAPDDVRNQLPPKDGAIAGGSVNGDLPVLNEQSPTRWTKIPLQANAVQTFKWEYAAVHATRRWNYFITRADWDPATPLTRAQFEAQPFCMVQNAGQPYWQADLQPPQPTVHQCRLPDRTGYQVILAVWEVADSPRAFYQVVDTYFNDPKGSPVMTPF
ncbi:lytic polysaccharide monooxygenase [Paraburkholderia sp. BCC1884]|uniref:lytic polysaccharide monooxygenase n=1 Tax=Paraburkholderia sp. BCC1884 TaxID=2562668 RepID=UPI0011835D5D|nr:lytic polysaccharide monooxygenase [Paraburkholderia sp. BCC1884]